MSIVSEKQKDNEVRKKLSIELCDNLIQRLNPNEQKQIKIGAIIAIRNFVKESKIDDSILLSCLIDTLADPDKEIRDWVIRVIKEIINPEVIELLEIKLEEVKEPFIKREIKELLASII